jgi:mono/diheme cytochrome c family protein
LIAVLSLHGSAARQQQPDRRTVWSGVYTEAQAIRGAAAFQSHCQACHGTDLSGSEGPALTGFGFMRSWTGLTVRELFHHIRVAMPEGAAESVSDPDKLDILTFIFQQNGFPAGREPLTANSSELAMILIEGPDGPEPPPTGATVHTVGCLRKPAADSWLLERASEPARTTLEAARAISPEDRAGVPPGSRTIRLIGISTSESREGQRVVVRGLMIRGKDNETINVLEIATVSPSCVP